MNSLIKILLYGIVPPTPPDPVTGDNQQKAGHNRFANPGLQTKVYFCDQKRAYPIVCPSEIPPESPPPIL